MPIVGCAIVPNSSILLPGLAADVRRTTAKLGISLQQIAMQLYARQPDILFLVAETSSYLQPTLLQSSSFNYSFSELGDISTVGSWPGAVGFIHRLKEKHETTLALPLVTPARLPESIAIPLTRLTALAAKTSCAALLLPKALTPDNLELLGKALSEAFASARERIAIVACGTLGVHSKRCRAEAKVYEQTFLNALAQGSTDELLNIDAQVRERVGETLWAPVSLLGALMKPSTFIWEHTEYSAPAGVGLVVSLSLCT